MCAWKYEIDRGVGVHRRASRVFPMCVMFRVSYARSRIVNSCTQIYWPIENIDSEHVICVTNVTYTRFLSMLWGRNLSETKRKKIINCIWWGFYLCLATRFQYDSEQFRLATIKRVWSVRNGDSWLSLSLSSSHSLILSLSLLFGHEKFLILAIDSGLLFPSYIPSRY